MNVKDGLFSNLEPIEKKNTENEEEKIENEVTSNKITSVIETNNNNAEPIRNASDDHSNTDIEQSIFMPPTLQERFLRIKQIVKEAIAAHHTFMIYGRARVIRESMLKRGWCEKFYCKNNNDANRPTFTADQYLNVDSSPVALLSGIGDLKDQQSERQLISRMLSNHPVDFLWNAGSEWPGWPSQENKTTIFNRYCRAGFTSKVGLCSNVRQMHWYYEPGVANTLFPRCYNLCQGDQMHAFIEDFRFTACLGLLKWLVDKINAEGENAVRSPTGTIPLKALDFAIRRCSDFIEAQSHEDIDQEAERIWSHQWDQFICWYYKIIQNQALFVRNSVPFNKYFLASRHVLKKVRKYWPQLDMDGIMNIWILKPGNKSRGRGIVLMNKLEDVLDKVNPANKADNRFVVQKYIERPFLIYQTKFDIRQWFMVTCAQPLTLWIYKESYLRFCTQKFSLSDFHESIHLCNHAVQCKYTNCTDRDSALPSDNMWDATTFKAFLKTQGHSEVWDELIYPGMKQGLVGSLLASQEAMDRRKNSFELYGADFMVMEDFSVWLIEINSHPDMSSSSSVTTRLCRQVMEDVIKDFREDKSADTGQFELCYKQRMPSCQPYLGAALSLQGTKITACERKQNSSTQDSKFNLISKLPMTSLSQKKSTVHSHIGPVIVDLIEELEIQLDQEFYSYYKMEHPKEALPMLEPPAMSTAGVEPMNIETNTKTVAANSPSNNVKTKIIKLLPNSLQPNSTKTNSPFKALIQSPQKKAEKSQKVVNNPRAKSEVPPTKPSIISKIVELQKQASKSASIQKSSKSSQQKQISDEKIIQTAMKKYKKNSIIRPEVPKLPSLLSPLATKKVNRGSLDKGKIQKRQYSKKKKVSSNVGDMYAVGLSMNKQAVPAQNNL